MTYSGNENACRGILRFFRLLSPCSLFYPLFGTRQQMLGDNETGTSGNRVITWKSVSQERLDSKTLKAEHPTLYKKYANKTSYRRFSIKAAV